MQEILCDKRHYRALSQDRTLNHAGQKSGSGQLWITRLYRGILNSEAQKRPFRH